MKNTILKTLTVALSISAIMALTGCSGTDGIQSDTQLVGSTPGQTPPGQTPPGQTPPGQIPPGGEKPPVGQTPIASITDFSDPAMMEEFKVKAVGLDYSDGTLKLALQSEDTTFPFIWIANSAEGTISKLDINTGEELGRYKTGPGTSNGNPSRTTVDQDGNVWVGNRAGNTITKVGLKEFDQCIDRNGNGVIDTSTDGTNILGWSGQLGTDLGIANAEDECILQHVAMQANGIATPTNIRLVAITPDNNLFVGGSSQRSLFKVDNKTGQILDAVETLDTHYGGVVDKAGNLWSMPGSHNGKVEKINSDMTQKELIAIGHSGYGVTVDKYGKVWTSSLSTTAFSCFNPIDPVGTLKVFQQTGHSGAQGITTDNNGDVFIAGNLFSGSHTVGHYKQVLAQDGSITDVTFVANYNVGDGPTGVAVDGKGLVWSSNVNSNNVSRINIATGDVDTYPVGSGPYNYSDMTGNIVRTITKRQGTWEATLNAQKADYAWASAVWKVQDGAPEGTEVKVYIKAANTELALNALDYTETLNAVKIEGVTGKYLRIKIELTAKTSDTTPVVLEIKIY